MDPGNGQLYDYDEVKKLDAVTRERLVMMEGNEENIRTIAAHVERGTRGDRRRAARKAQRLARRKNR